MCVYVCACTNKQVSKQICPQTSSFPRARMFLAFKELTVLLGVRGQSLVPSPGSLHSTDFFGDSRMQLRHRLPWEACLDPLPTTPPGRPGVS